MAMGETMQDTIGCGMNFEMAALWANAEHRPLLFLGSDLNKLKGRLKDKTPFDFPAPRLRSDAIEIYWPRGYQEVRRFFVSKSKPTPWEILGYDLSPHSFLHEALELTETKGSLFWTIQKESRFHITICAFERVPTGTVPILFSKRNSRYPKQQPKDVIQWI
jgi:hypothetical protein